MRSLNSPGRSEPVNGTATRLQWLGPAQRNSASCRPSAATGRQSLFRRASSLSNAICPADGTGRVARDAGMGHDHAGTAAGARQLDRDLRRVAVAGRDPVLIGYLLGVDQPRRRLNRRVLPTEPHAHRSVRSRHLHANAPSSANADVELHGYGVRASSTDLRLAKSFRFARRIAGTMIGAYQRENPFGRPRLRNRICVPPEAVAHS
jgi:hypothetical protein